MASTRVAALLLASSLVGCLSYNKLASAPKTEVTVSIGVGELALAGLFAISHDAPGFDTLSRTDRESTPPYGERLGVTLLTIVFTDALVAGVAWMADQGGN